MGVVDVRAADLLWSTLYALNLVSFEDGDPIDRDDLGADGFYASSGRSDGPVTVYRHVELALMMALTRLTGDPSRAEDIREALADSGEDVGYHLTRFKRERWDREDAVIKSGRDGVLISDALARSIAADYITSATLDASLTAMATGAQYDPYEVYVRVTTLITSADEFAGTDLVPELYALRDWVGERVPGITVYTQSVPAEQWSEAVSNGDAGPSVFPPDRTVEHVAAAVDGGWLYPDDPYYPADWKSKGYERDERDGSVFVPETIAETVARLLDQHYVDECSADPHTPGAWYELHSEHAYTGEVTHKSVHLTGLTPEQEAEVHALWRKSMRPGAVV